jgi:hypothetical protein
LRNSNFECAISVIAEDCAKDKALCNVLLVEWPSYCGESCIFRRTKQAGTAIANAEGAWLVFATQIFLTGVIS